MSIFKRIASHLIAGYDANPRHDIQQSPVTWSPGGGQASVTIKLDHVVRLGRMLLIAGWASAPGRVRLKVAGIQVPTRRFSIARPDVARYLGRTNADELGLVLLAEDVDNEAVELECMDGDGNPVAAYPVQVRQGGLSADARIHLAPALDYLRESGKFDESLVDGLGSSSSAFAGSVLNYRAAGTLDDARSSPESHLAVVSGWLVRAAGVEAWIEDAEGRRHGLDNAHWVHRQDVQDSLTAELSGYGESAGFMLRLEGVAPGERVKLVVHDGKEKVTLAEIACASWGTDPVAASRWLFAFPTPISMLAERISRIDLPVLDALIEARQRQWPDLPVRIDQVGSQIMMPRASIIIPLYGRFDFVEHQLIEFARDAWLRENAEVIYVVDDHALVERMATEAWQLYALYRVPFRWIWGGTNRGFAGANNLGATHAQGEHLIFLNSDAFPRDPGWALDMLTALETDPAVGAAGVRLLFGDGSLQHAGMEFARREDFGIWANHHPNMGLDPSLDPHASPADVPCVTGACVALRRRDLEAVGGWDTGYLIGDFEDSDLCMKLRAAGFRIRYLPSVELTHLERQSFKLLGKGDYRTRVVIYNAVRHQQRWRSEIEFIANDREKGQPR